MAPAIQPFPLSSNHLEIQAWKVVPLQKAAGGSTLMRAYLKVGTCRPGIGLALEPRFAPCITSINHRKSCPSCEAGDVEAAQNSPRDCLHAVALQKPSCLPSRVNASREPCNLRLLHLEIQLFFFSCLTLYSEPVPTLASRNNPIRPYDKPA